MVSPTEGWMVTNAGWLFHYTDGTPLPKDTDPAFAGPITERPNEAAEQFVPDSAPADDSQLFAPPPVAVEPEAPATEEPKQLPRLISGLSKPKVSKRLVLTLSFKVARAREGAAGRQAPRARRGQDRQPDARQGPLHAQAAALAQALADGAARSRPRS